MIVKLPVTWEMCGSIEIEAESIEDAIQMATETDILDSIGLPEGAYVDASFALSSDDPEIVRLYQRPLRKESLCPTSSN